MFYPMDPVPSSLDKLCRVISQPLELRRVVNHQIHDGARFALALVHSHCLVIDFMLAARGPPGGRSEPMKKHYEAADEHSLLVVKKVCEENDRVLGALYKMKAEPDV